MGHALEEAICYRVVLLGITRASLNNQNFIYEASFQETARVLAKAALQGRIDWWKGLKENEMESQMAPYISAKRKSGQGNMNVLSWFHQYSKGVIRYIRCGSRPTFLLANRGVSGTWPRLASIGPELPLQTRPLAEGIARQPGAEWKNTNGGELVEFEEGTIGIALNLESNNVGVVLMGDGLLIQEGSSVKATGRIAQIPVSEAYLVVL
ncbi:hypothetical protein HAX54_052037 [Datura stramonium]|uniref:ATPase F1/V1/A1 complex alpha/beta subunit N-terminal domain-containing protein n=1 Tax=Datura stramonium TaxID=4076 RepID=A0ABS8SYE8_DATST|nr:hypothetical protein [Datura stramonium]